MNAEDAGPDPWSDLGPSVPPRMAVYRQAAELEQLARMARDLASAGPLADVPRAMRVLDRARALLNGP